MLVKKELLEIAPLKFPEQIPLQELRRANYAASAGVCELKRSGTILTVDIFDTKTRELKLRFFSDGASYISYTLKEWTKQNPTRILNYSGLASTQKDDDLVYEFLKAGQGSWKYNYNRSVGSCVDGFVHYIGTKKSTQAREHKYALMEQHFDMYPEYPDDLDMYCERHVFEHSYIFIGKAEKNNRSALCGHCKRRFRVKKDISVPGSFGYCPKCGIRGKYRGDWIKSTIDDKAKICIAHKSPDNQLILRWAQVVREFTGTEYKYYFYDYHRNLYLDGVIYSYRYMSVMGYGWDWFRKKNGEVNYDRAHIYANNLTEIFGSAYYHVDLQNGLKNAREISFAGLLDNLKNIPAAEYLFKTGLSTLAANMTEPDLYSGGDFSEVLGVGRQYLPLYKKYNVDVCEHKIVRASGAWVSDESFGKFRELKAERNDTGI